jgi:hypothetical protein
MSVEWIQYKGKQILYTNYGGVTDNIESKKQLELQMKTISESPEPVLLLVNLEGTTMTPEASQFAKEQLILLGAKVKKSALIGVTGFKPTIVEGIGRATNLNQEIFGTMEAAKDWLVA